MIAQTILRIPEGNYFLYLHSARKLKETVTVMLINPEDP